MILQKILKEAFTGRSLRYHSIISFLMDMKTLCAMHRKAGFRDAITLEYSMNNYTQASRRTGKAGAHREASTDKVDR